MTAEATTAITNFVTVRQGAARTCLVVSGEESCVCRLKELLAFMVVAKSARRQAWDKLARGASMIMITVVFG